VDRSRRDGRARRPRRSARFAPCERQDAGLLLRARDAYARGAAAYAQGDYSRAARELAVADELVPDATTLRAALEAVTRADDAVLGIELLARTTRDPSDPELARVAELARARFQHRTAKIAVRCDGCVATIDGAPARIGSPNVVLPGVHTVTVQRQRSPETRLVTVAPDEEREVFVRTIPAAAPEVRPSPQPASGVSPSWFIGAALATVALASVTTWSLVDTVNDHVAFDSARCGESASGACASDASTGESAQTRTQWLAVGTVAAVVGTTALGLFGVRWHSAAKGDVALSASAGSAGLRVSFR
jgi:hypothetical protein